LPSNTLKLIQKFQYFVMRVTVKEGWNEKSKMAIVAIVISLSAIVAIVLLD